MFLKTTADGSLVEVIDLNGLFDPFSATVQGRLHAGEEMQDPEALLKAELAFPSGEQLPACWVKPDYTRY